MTFVFMMLVLAGQDLEKEPPRIIAAYDSTQKCVLEAHKLNAQEKTGKQLFFCTATVFSI